RGGPAMDAPTVVRLRLPGGPHPREERSMTRSHGARRHDPSAGRARHRLVLALAAVPAAGALGSVGAVDGGAFGVSAKGLLAIGPAPSVTLPSVGSGGT